ncbi:phospholipase D-like domain-containing protein [Qipengyuania sediminis]|uniref:phospholipase D-like domain-containing protein n=1 Tax=Qipengyuania sediminis TaxID=1532023 RepID=UPI00105A45BB|nr:phosphatidylserine/phosphatidylglycerophosphate/cardiolipin synthase family protein [Qipengyuania sediminis]
MPFLPDSVESEAGKAVAHFADPAGFEAVVGEHRLTFYPSGADRREALLALIRGARRSLALVFYIFAEDAAGRAVRDALAEAAARGVRVTLIIDRFGSAASAAFLAPLVQAGGRFLCFSPRWSQAYLIRNHQKMAIADDRQAIFGGFNIAEDYFAPPGPEAWTDLAIGLEGPAVAGLTEWFGKLAAWSGDDGPNFGEIRRAVKRWDWSDGRLRWLVGGPTRGLSTWARCVREDLTTGRRLDMIMAYFSPSRRALTRIGALARRGEARLVLAAKSDNTATIGAARALYGYLLKRGARLFEFQPAKLHTKLIVLDDTVYIGSANFDVRSLYLNLEIMLRVEDAALAERMRGFVAHHIAASEAITPALHATRATPLNRFRWWLGWVLVTVIDYTVTRRLNPVP